MESPRPGGQKLGVAGSTARDSHPTLTDKAKFSVSCSGPPAPTEGAFGTGGAAGSPRQCPGHQIPASMALGQLS